MAQTPRVRGDLYEPPCKGHLEVCAIYSQTTVNDNDFFQNSLQAAWTPHAPAVWLSCGQLPRRLGTRDGHMFTTRHAEGGDADDAVQNSREGIL